MSTTWIGSGRFAHPDITFPFTPNSGGGTGTPSTVTMVAPTNDTIGSNDIVIGAACVRRNQTLTAPGSGATWQTVVVSAGPSSAAGFNLYAYFHRGTPASWVFTLSPGSTSGWAWATDVARNVDTGLSLSAVPTGTPTTGTDASIESPTISSLAANSLGLIIAGYSDSGGTVPSTFGTAPGGWTNRKSEFRQTSAQQGVHIAIASATGTSYSSATWTLDDTPENWGCHVFGLPRA